VLPELLRDVRPASLRGGDHGRAVPGQRGQLPLTELGGAPQIGEDLPQPPPFVRDGFGVDRLSRAGHDESHAQENQTTRPAAL
jgi:hypothetical protein